MTGEVSAISYADADADADAGLTTGSTRCPPQLRRMGSCVPWCVVCAFLLLVHNCTETRDRPAFPCCRLRLTVSHRSLAGLGFSVHKQYDVECSTPPFSCISRSDLMKRSVLSASVSVLLVACFFLSRIASDLFLFLLVCTQPLPASNSGP